MTLTDLVKYALHALRPAMAKFLIQAGADVNSLEKDYGNLLSSVLNRSNRSNQIKYGNSEICQIKSIAQI
jgi:hypothetical protein